MEAVFTGKEITKNYFFLMIDADDFQITAEGGYSVPAVGYHGEFKIPCPAAAGRSGFPSFHMNLSFKSFSHKNSQ